MAKPAPEDATAMKGLRDARKGLVRLEKDLRKAVKKFTRGELDRQKMKAAQAKIADFVAGQRSTLKLRGASSFDGLSKDSQAGVAWLGDVVGELSGFRGRLDGCKRFLKRDPVNDRTILVKTIRDYRAEIGKPNKELSVLLKMVKKGNEAEHPAGAQLNAVPMVILLWLVVEAIMQSLRKF